jgi:rare lipoprotein A
MAHKLTTAIITLCLLFLACGSLAGEELGLASWYGGKFQGRQTASGEIFDTNQFTAAHKSLPFGSIVKVTNLKNLLVVEVRINDRGPFVKDRIIDLSRAAADVIGLTAMGVAPVKLEILHMPIESSLYNIQVGAFRNKQYALNMMDRIQSTGLTVQLMETENNIIRVLVTDISNEQMSYTKELLQEVGFSEFLIRRQPLAE